MMHGCPFSLTRTFLCVYNCDVAPSLSSLYIRKGAATGLNDYAQLLDGFAREVDGVGAGHLWPIEGIG